jgi:hypothetical protein
MEEKYFGVHRTHCCIKHGCKYGDKDCPVVEGKIKQDYICEECDIEGITSIEEINYFPTRKIYSITSSEKDDINIPEIFFMNKPTEEDIMKMLHKWNPNQELKFHRMSSKDCIESNGYGYIDYSILIIGKNGYGDYRQIRSLKISEVNVLFNEGEVIW